MRLCNADSQSQPRSFILLHQQGPSCVCGGRMQRSTVYLHCTSLTPSVAIVQ
jgi:hypothetical protein